MAEASLGHRSYSGVGESRTAVHRAKEAKDERISMKVNDSRAFRGDTWAGKAALFCLGLIAMLALVVMIVALTSVMLAATAFPATPPWPKRELRGRRHGRTTSGLSAPREAVASQGQQGR